MKTLMPKVDTRDGLFHNGNPAIGEQGTQVKDVWLNNVQENLRDIQAEAHYVLRKAGFNPEENKQTQLYESIVKIIGDNRKTATTKDKGEVKLNSTIDSGIETEAATPKAVKAAYDKGVEAKTAADTAQRTANDGVSKANAAQTSANAAQHTANDGILRANAAQTSANAAQRTANEGVSRANVAQRTANDANNNANTRQLKSELVGEVAFFACSTPPSGWLKANGAAVSRTTYAALFAAIGTAFGAGDGRTTFNLPDLRGEFLRCLDDGRNIDRGRRLGTAQGDAIRNITGKLDGSAMGSGNQVLEGKMIASGAIGTTYQQRQWSGDQGGWGEQSVSFDFDASRVVPTASENRPRNVALLACIKY